MSISICVNGRLFNVASTSVKNVTNACAPIGLSLIIKVKHLLVTLLIHSQDALIQELEGGLNFKIFFSPLFAPKTLVPLSLHIVFG